MKLNIADTFRVKLPADPIMENSRRQVFKSCFSYVTPKKPKAPKLIHAVNEMAMNLGLTETDTQTKSFLDFVSGNQIQANTQPYAMCYGGHQFGHWAGQLGDGRAINLMEVVHNNRRWALQLKGAGETPYSRSADGLAVLRSSIREHLCSEAMFHLGVPTTRSLSLSLSGDEVLRDVLYDGNAAHEKGAIVCRVAPSFIRFGNFEILASRQDHETLRKLTDYTINEYYPHIKAGSKTGYLDFFTTVLQNTITMLVHWQRVGFVHGVMNTDNMSIHGLTIDYGPYGWLEGYDPGWTPNTTDRQFKRYRYGNQAQIGLWNLLQLANALFPLIAEAKPLEAILATYNGIYEEKYLAMMRSKLGLQKTLDTDARLIDNLEENLRLTETDMTIFFRNLGKITATTTITDDASFLKPLEEAFYAFETVKEDVLTAWKNWFTTYTERLAIEDQSSKERVLQMHKVNPKYVLRNYMAQLVIDAADEGDYQLLQDIHEVLKKPYDEQIENEKWFAKRPEWARHKVGCSMLSCSS